MLLFTETEDDITMGDNTIDDATIEEAKQICEAATDEELEEADSADVVAEAASLLESTSEEYYNLREAMLIREHQHIVRSMNGIISEDEAESNSATDKVSFFQKVKALLEKLKNFIVAKFQQVVQFFAMVFKTNSFLFSKLSTITKSALMAAHNGKGGDIKIRKNSLVDWNAYGTKMKDVTKRISQNVNALNSKASSAGNVTTKEQLSTFDGELKSAYNKINEVFGEGDDAESLTKIVLKKYTDEKKLVDVIEDAKKWFTDTRTSINEIKRLRDLDIMNCKKTQAYCDYGSKCAKNGKENEKAAAYDKAVRYCRKGINKLTKTYGLLINAEKSKARSSSALVRKAYTAINGVLPKKEKSSSGEESVSESTSLLSLMYDI